MSRNPPARSRAGGLARRVPWRTLGLPGNAARSVAVQMAGLGISLLDRIVLTGILLRHWGTEAFSDWTTVSSAAGVVVLFEFGFQHLVGNQLAKAHARGRELAFTRILGWASFSALVLGAIMTLAVLLLSIALPLDQTLNLFSADFVPVFLVLALWNIVRVVRGPLLQFYRGREEVHNLLWADSRANLAAIVLAGVLVLLGAGPLTIAVVYLIVTIVLSVGYSWLDIRRRFPGRLARPRQPSPLAVRRGARALRWYGAFYTANNLMQNAPVLIIAGLGLSGPLLVAFVVQRTLVNFARTVSFNIAVAIGAELSGARHRGQTEVVEQGFALLARLNVTLIALTAAGLLLFGGFAVQLWTGQPDLGSPLLLTLLILPAIAVAPVLGMQLTSVFSDRVALQATTSLVNIALGIGGGIVLGQRFGIVGIAGALALAEIVATGILSAIFAARDFQIRYLPLFGRTMGLFVLVFAWCYGSGAALMFTWPANGTAAMVIRITTWMALVAPVALWVCLSAPARERLLRLLARQG